MSFNSWSRRDFSKGRLGVTYVLLQTQVLATGMATYWRLWVNKSYYKNYEW